LEALREGLGIREARARRLLDVEDAFALGTDGVVVRLDLAIEPARASRMWDARHQSESDERVEDSIHGRSRDPGQDAAGVFEQLFGRGVTVVVDDGVHHDTTLHRDGKTVVAAECFETFGLLSSAPRIHAAPPMR